MTTEGLLVIPQRGGFDYDDDAHQRNLRAIEKWARGPKAFESFVDVGTAPTVANYDDGTVVFAGDVLYVRAAGAWEALSLASDLTAHLNDTSAAHAASAVSIADAGGYFTGTDVEAALQELGASPGAGWTTLTLAADQTTVSTTLVDVNTLQVSLAASTKYRIRGMVVFAVASGGVNRGMHWRHLGSTSPTYFILKRTRVIVSSAESVTVETASSAADINELFNSGTTEVIVTFDVIIQNGANSGTFKLQFDTVNAADTQTVRAGSYLEYSTV